MTRPASTKPAAPSPAPGDESSADARRSPDATQEPEPAAAAVPAGAPPWVTAELIAHTIRVWQPRYAQKLTAENALEILLNVAALFDVLNGRTPGSISPSNCGA